MTLQFQKQCSFPLMQIGTYTGASNVMVDTVPLSSFSQFLYTQDTPMTTFQVFLAQTQTDPTLLQQPFELIVTSDNAGLIIQPLGMQGWSGVASQTLEGDIDVGYTCNNPLPGQFTYTVTAELAFGWHPTVKFTYLYRCGASQPLIGLSLGSYPAYSNMALDGVVLPPWNSSMGYNYAPQQNYDLIFRITSEMEDSVNYNITLVSENSSVYNLLAVSPTGGHMAIGGLVRSMDFLASIQCQSSGVAVGLAQFLFNDNTPLQPKWSFECIDPLVNVGNEPLDADMIIKGVGQNFVGKATAEAMQQQFYVALDASSTLTQAFYTLSMNTQDGSILAPSFLDPNNGTALREPNPNHQPVVLQFNCQPCVTAYSNPIVVTVDWGWANTPNFTIYKVRSCTNTHQHSDTKQRRDNGWLTRRISTAHWLELLLCCCFCFRSSSPLSYRTAFPLPMLIVVPTTVVVVVVVGVLVVLLSLSYSC